MQTETASHFHSQIAHDFDALYKHSPAFRERYQVWTSLLDQYIKPNSTVLDLGCGSGIFSFYLADKQCKVLGIDGAENMIQLCNKRKIEGGYIHTDFIRSELPLPALQLPETKFGAVISSSVLEYIEDLDSVLNNVQSLLLPNGIFIVSFPNRHSIYRKLEKWSYSILGKPIYYKYVRHLITPEYLNTILTKRGYKLVETQYYASSGKIMRVIKSLFPVKNANNLFVSVYKKQ